VTHVPDSKMAAQKKIHPPHVYLSLPHPSLYFISFVLRGHAHHQPLRLLHHDWFPKSEGASAKTEEGTSVHFFSRFFESKSRGKEETTTGERSKVQQKGIQVNVHGTFIPRGLAFDIKMTLPPSR